MTAGRKPLHPNVHRLHGNASKKPAAQLSDVFSPDVELASCPRHLNKEARAEYWRLGRQLEQYGLVSKLDRGVLAMMCVEWSRHVWAEEKISELNTGDAVGGEAGLVDRTPSGFKQQSVYLQISRKSIEIYQKLAAEFGLTPSARTRVSQGATQMALPGLEDPARPSLRSFA